MEKLEAKFLKQEEYEKAMLRSKQFQYFGILPIWKVDEGDIDGFCHDEVVRQFHNPEVEWDGGARVRQMRSGWDYALARQERLPVMEDIRALGKLIEPGDNSDMFFRSMNVYIGNRMGFPPGSLEPVMTALAARISHLERIPGRSIKRGPDTFFPLDETLFIEDIQDSVLVPDDWYLAYEWVHPWADGNGRTGKILHNWLHGTLEEPQLVRDYFGGGNP